MPSENFEKSLRERLKGVEIPPRPEVWEGVATQLTSPKWYQRKGLIWASAAIIALLLGLAGVWGWKNLGTPEPLKGISLITESAPSIEEVPSAPVDISRSGEASQVSSSQNLTPATSDKPEVLPPSEAFSTQENLVESEEAGIPTHATVPATTVTSKKAIKGKPERLDWEADQQLLTPYEQSAEVYSPRYNIQPLGVEGLPDLIGKPMGEPLPYSQTAFESLSGTGIPNGPKLSWGFFLAPAYPWYTSASLSVEFEPQRDHGTADDPFTELPAEVLNTPSLVLYEVTYARTGIQGGLELAYHMGERFRLQTGVGIFVSGNHTLAPINTGSTDPNFSGNESEQNEIPPTYTFRTLQMEVPLVAQYQFETGRSSWVLKGGVSLNSNLDKLNFPQLTDEDQPDTRFQVQDASQPLLVEKQSNLQATLGISYQFQLNPKLFIYMGPSHSYGLTPVYTTMQGKSIYLNRFAINMGVNFR